jgi:signal transduction histidine kinase
MKFWKRRPPLILIVTLALFALLPVLAILQYQWMGRISEAARERMQTNLRDGASKFTQDFDREIARAFFSFQSSETNSEALAAALADSYAHWSASTTFPQLINGIYLVQADANHPVLRRVNLTTRQLEPVEWSENLDKVKERFQAQFQNVSGEAGEAEAAKVKLPGMKSDFLQIFQNDIEPLVSEVPALIIHNLPTKIGDDVAFLPFHSRSFTVITLDFDTIKQEMIPQLAARYFSGGNGLDYNLTIVDAREPQNIIYQSDASATTQSSNSDAAANLFNVRLAEMNSVVKARASHTTEETKLSGKKTNRVAVQVFSSARGDLSLEKMHQSMIAANTGKWQLLLQHRSGSLGAVVTSARRKNLAISFGVLILLTLSIAMLLVSTRRANRLAEQQMEFVAGVSHELRTPLAVIRSAGENLADGVIDEKNQIKRYGALIASEGRRLTEMVEQILEFSGIQSGKKNYLLRTTPVNNVIEHAIAACVPMLEEGGFELNQEIASELPIVAADEAALSRSIQNLLTNAMKYSGANRMITIKAQTHKTVKGQEVQITVVDKGLGIPAEDLPHIFEPFYRGREAVASQIHGSGLGLSLVKKIIEAHDGSVSVTSTEGTGSEFTLKLPAVKDAEVKEWQVEADSRLQTSN